MPSGTSCDEDDDDNGDVGDDGNFLGVNPRALCCHSRGSEPRDKELPDKTSVKWRSLCGFWDNHFRAGHIATNAIDSDAGQLCGDIAEMSESQAPPEVEVILLVGFIGIRCTSIRRRWSICKA